MFSLSKFFSRTLAILFITAVLSGCSNTSDNGTLKRADKSEEYFKLHNILLERIVWREEKNIQDRCQDKTIVNKQMIELDAIRFDHNNSLPSKGRWLHKVTIKSCEEERTHNIFATATNGGVSLQVGIMGDTVTSLLLQQDTLKLLEPAVSQKLLKFCQDKASKKRPFRVYDSVMTKYSHTGKGSFIEEWFVETCGQRAKVIINFTNDGNGGTYFSISGDKITMIK